MLPGLEGERLLQLGRDFEAQRNGFRGLVHDFGDLQLVEMDGHLGALTTSRPDRCAAKTASRQADGRDARYDGRAGLRGSDAALRAYPVALRRERRQSPRDIRLRT